MGSQRVHERVRDRFARVRDLVADMRFVVVELVHKHMGQVPPAAASETPAGSLPARQKSRGSSSRRHSNSTKDRSAGNPALALWAQGAKAGVYMDQLIG